MTHLQPTLVRILAILAIIVGFSIEGSSQTLTSTSDGTLNAVVVYGTLTPGNSDTLTSAQVQFRIRGNSPTGYKVTAALSSFTVDATSPANGGSTATAADIGIGIIAVDTSGAMVIKPRSDTASFGFNYDPEAVTVTNGLTPYAGVAAGQATLADLGSGYKILSGPKIANAQNMGSGNFIAVTMKLGLLRQYFTPASFTAVITLAISNGQN